MGGGAPGGSRQDDPAHVPKRRRFRAALRWLLVSPLLARHGLGWCALVAGDRTAAREHFAQAAAVDPAAAYESSLLCWALDRSTDLTGLPARIEAADRTLFTARSSFHLAELRALALLATGRTAEGLAVFERAMPARWPGDRFRRPLYDLLAEPPAVRGLATVLDHWQALVKADPEAGGPWGHPGVPVFEPECS